MPEVHARRHLRGRVAVLSVLAPVGPFAGKGALRVLRVLAHGEAGDEARLEVTCGYESYERVG
ncbi:MAG TPA: hypothetical protein VFW34_09010 [Candidatus Rubrimentiphilum sp.]|nr:hypothetical protein [Candidatus Rubrimentiphilum sp.]